MSKGSLPDPGRCSTARNIYRAAFTLPPFLVQHLWRRRRIDDETRTVVALDEQPPEPSGHDGRSTDPAVQEASDGSGPLVMRTFEVRILGADHSPEQLMQKLIARPGDLNDDRIAGFVVDDKPATDLAVGDELVVELPGPWNGPVCVTRADTTNLLLQTLDRHMEAGQIRFDVTGPHDRLGDRHDYTFRIRSWARGGDPAFVLFHLGFRIAKELQTAMWVAMCEGAVRVSGGHRGGPIKVTTELLADSTPDDELLGGALESLGGD